MTDTTVSLYNRETGKTTVLSDSLSDGDYTNTEDISEIVYAALEAAGIKPETFELSFH